jgi:hypothetical protein
MDNDLAGFIELFSQADFDFLCHTASFHHCQASIHHGMDLHLEKTPGHSGPDLMGFNDAGNGAGAGTDLVDDVRRGRGVKDSFPEP